MSGSKEGYRKRRTTLIAKFGEDYFKKAMDHARAARKNPGFGSLNIGEDGLTGQERASIAGKKGGPIGGKKSKRPKKIKVIE